jgi:uncharacterized membrane protein
MRSLFAAAIFFVGIHFVISGSPIRGKIVAKIGEGPFRGLFSLLSLIGVVWLSRAYGQAGYIPLWGKPYAFRPVALVVMLLAFFFVVLAFTTPNPTAVGGEALLREKEPAKGIQRITRHPFLWGVALWAFTHLILNGDIASLVFFGSFLILAIEGPFSIDQKRKNTVGDAWSRFAAVTSNLPFLAIIQGRNSLQLAEIGWWRPLVSVIIYGLFLHFHRSLFGVSPLPL